MGIQKKVSKTKKNVSRVFSQARESLKLLETLEKETIAKARSFVKFPKGVVRTKKVSRTTNDKILIGLKKIGVASRDEVESLRLRIEKLEAALSVQTESKQNLEESRPL